MWAMRVRACRRGCGGDGRRGRDSPGSKSGDGERAENDLNFGAKRRGMCRESALGLYGGLDWVAVSDRAVIDPKREDPNSGLVTGPCSRSGTDASTEMARLWISRRLWAVVEVPLLDVELSASLGLRLDALRRANGTITSMRATIKIKPPMLATAMIAGLLLFEDVVVGGVAVC